MESFNLGLGMHVEVENDEVRIVKVLEPNLPCVIFSASSICGDSIQVDDWWGWGD